MFSDFAGQKFWRLLFRRTAPAGCRRRAFHPTRICQARTRIPCAIPPDIATMSSQFQFPRRGRLAQTHSCGVWTSSITVITGRLTRPRKAFGGLRIETAAAHALQGLDPVVGSQGQDSRAQTCRGSASRQTRRSSASSTDESARSRLRARAKHVTHGARRMHRSGHKDSR